MKIDKEIKIAMLKALRSGTMDDDLYLKLSKEYHANLTDDELDKRIKELETKIKKSNGIL